MMTKKCSVSISFSRERNDYCIVMHAWSSDFEARVILLNSGLTGSYARRL
jgi:hypothetical protein